MMDEVLDTEEKFRFDYEKNSYYVDRSFSKLLVFKIPPKGEAIKVFFERKRKVGSQLAAEIFLKFPEKTSIKEDLRGVVVSFPSLIPAVECYKEMRNHNVFQSVGMLQMLSDRDIDRLLNRLKSCGRTLEPAYITKQKFEEEEASVLKQEKLMEEAFRGAMAQKESPNVSNNVSRKIKTIDSKVTNGSKQMTVGAIPKKGSPNVPNKNSGQIKAIDSKVPNGTKQMTVGAIPKKGSPNVPNKNSGQIKAIDSKVPNGTKQMTVGAIPKKGSPNVPNKNSGQIKAIDSKVPNGTKQMTVGAIPKKGSPNVLNKNSRPIKALDLSTVPLVNEQKYYPDYLRFTRPYEPTANPILPQFAQPCIFIKRDRKWLSRYVLHHLSSFIYDDKKLMSFIKKINWIDEPKTSYRPIDTSCSLLQYEACGLHEVLVCSEMCSEELKFFLMKHFPNIYELEYYTRDGIYHETRYILAYFKFHKEASDFVNSLKKMRFMANKIYALSITDLEETLKSNQI